MKCTIQCVETKTFIFDIFSFDFQIINEYTGFHYY